MIPSNLGHRNNNGCGTSTSSNCVIWQGPDIPCLNLCNGDTVSAVIAKMGEQLCDILAGINNQTGADLDITQFNFACLTEQTGTTPEDFTGLVDLITAELCTLMEDMHDHCIINQCTVDLTPYKCLENTIEDLHPMKQPESFGLAMAIEVLAAYLCECCTNTHRMRTDISKLDERVKNVERKVKTTYVPPKVVPRYVGNQIGKPVDMQVMLAQLEQNYGVHRKAVGGSSSISAATGKQPQGLNAEKRLNGTGTMSAIPGWSVNPSNLADSIGNLWMSHDDVRKSLTDIQKSLISTQCSDVVYDFKPRLRTNSVDVVTGIVIDFMGTKLPDTTWTDCSPTGKGTKVTIKDKGLNSITRYVQVSQFVNNENGFVIGNLGHLDITSNFEIIVDFCFTDGSSQCARTISQTLDNSSKCPVLTTFGINDTQFSYSFTPTPAIAKYKLEIVTSDTNDNEVNVQTYDKPSIYTIGVVQGLESGKKYYVFARLTSPTGGTTNDCAKNTITTTVPACTSAAIEYDDFKTDYADLRVGAGQLKIACYNDGLGATDSVKETILGFDSSNNVCIYYGVSQDGTTSSAGDITSYGTFVSNNPTQSIMCGTTSYPVSTRYGVIDGNDTKSGWEYVGSIISPTNVSYYVYGLIDNTTKQVSQVVACCDCKSYYVRGYDGVISGIEYGRTDSFPYYAVSNSGIDTYSQVVGHTKDDETPTWSLNNSPIYGTSVATTQLDKKIAKFRYANTQTTDTAWRADSFVAKAVTECDSGGAKENNLVPVQKTFAIPNKDTDIYVFIDTNTTSYATGLKIKQSFEAVKTDIQSICTAWTGTIYYIPITGATTGDYLKHTKALVDMKLGASGSVTHAGTPSDGQWYDNVRSLPPYWSATAYGAPVPASAYVVSITASTSSYGTYGSATLGSGFTSQPTTNGGVGTTKYQEDYEALLDLLDYDAAKRTPWGATNGITYTQFSSGKYRHILMPIIDGTNNESAATALQMAGALFGTTVVEREFKGLVTGGNTYPVNLQGFLQTGVAAVSVPYTGTSATEGRTIKGLHEYGFVPFMAMETDDDFATTNLSFKKVLASLFGLSLDYIGTNCATTLPLVERMDSHGHYQFGTAATCADACTDAETLNASTVEIYNSTGTLFDTSVPAFSSIQGGNTSNVTSAGGTKNDELINDRWYAVYDGTSSASRAVGQYKTAGSPFWDNVKICSGC